LKRLRVGVIFGGRSGEHEVSLASAASVIANLDRTRYEPVLVRIDRDGRWILPDRPPVTSSAGEVIRQMKHEEARHAHASREVHMIAQPGENVLLAIDGLPTAELAAEPSEVARITRIGIDVFFPVLHGPYGEDGTIQGLFELAGVAYVGAGVAASAVGMDKALAKSVFAQHGLPGPAHVTVKAKDWHERPADVLARVTGSLGFPVFVKPANLGSSVGITKAGDVAQLEAALALAAEFDRKVLVEAAVPRAREIEVAVLGNDRPEASVPGEILPSPSREFYSYEAKYLDDDSTLLIPAPLEPAKTEEIRRLALAAFTAVDCAGMARVDFLVGGASGDVLLSEINTIPGFTTISMYPKLWAASGVDYPALLDRLIQLALERHAERQHLRTSYA
jgi:D-alanine-D-alanine ligase